MFDKRYIFLLLIRTDKFTTEINNNYFYFCFNSGKHIVKDLFIKSINNSFFFNIFRLINFMNNFFV